MTGGRRLPATAVPKRVSRGKREEQVRAEGIQTSRVQPGRCSVLAKSGTASYFAR